MKKPLVILDVTYIASIDQLHQLLSEALDFPGWYGANWNAFWDSITALVDMPETLQLIGWESFEMRFPVDAGIMRQCFDEMTEQLPTLAAHVEYL